MERTRIHPVTGKVLRRDVRPFTVHHRGLERVVDLPGWYPEDDSDGILESADMEVTDAARDELRAEFQQLPKPEEIKRIRKRLRLSQRRAGELLGGGTRAFQKYEKGDVAVSRPMANLLKLLDHEPSRLRELEDQKPEDRKLENRQSA